MKLTRKILSVLLTLLILMLSLSFCFVGFAADDSGGCGSGLTWKYSDATKTLTISGSGAMNDYQGKNDVSVRTPWDQYSSKTLQVIIENGVTRIGDNAFRYFKNITKIECPESVEAIGTNSFSNCESLVIAKLSSNLKAIGSYAFRKCYALKSFQLSDNVKSIGDYAFYNCAVTDLSLGRNVESIGSYAFSECKLVNVTMYNKVEVIGANAFAKQNGRATDVISHVYYYGSQTNWNAITIGNGNEPLTGASLHIMGAPSEPATQPAIQPTQPTTAAQQQDSGKQLSFFERILQMILDFFARLFGR